MKILKYIIITALLLPLFSSASNAQFAIMKTDADSLVLKGSEYIYNVKFDSASMQFREVIRRYPDHPVGYFLDAMVEWWKIWLYRGTERYDDNFLDKIEEVVEICDDHLDKDPSDINALFFKGGALGFRGRYHTIRHNWLQAIADGKEAYEILQRALKIAPGNHDIMLGTGIYNYFAAKIPEEKPFLKPFMTFFPKGDKLIGLLQLKAASNNARYAATEAEVVRLQVYYQFEENYTKALEIARGLHERFPDNPYFHRYVGKNLIIKNRLDSAEKIWREILIRYIDKKPAYDVFAAREALYYVGYCLMHHGEYEMAVKYFKKCIEASQKIDDEPSGFMVQANLRLAKLYDLLKKRDLAKKHYEKVLDMPDKQNSHDAAERYLERPYGK